MGDEGGEEEGEGAEGDAESELQEMFTQMDKDADGMLTVDEILSQVRESAAGSEEEGIEAEMAKLEENIKKNFVKADADADGKMTQDEATEFLRLFEVEDEAQEM